MTLWLRDLVAAGAAAAGCVLLASGLSKVRDRQMFGSQIAAYDLLPTAVAMTLGSMLPLAEIAAGTAVLVVPRIGGGVVALLFAVFGGAVVVNLARGRTELVCGCFGPRGRHTIGLWHVAGNAFLALVGIAASLTSDVHASLPAFVLGGSLLLAVMVLVSVREAWRPPIELIRMREE